MSTERKNTVAEGAVAYSAESRGLDWGESAAFERIFLALRRQGLGECAARLAYLRSTEDMEEDDAPLSLESARGFVNFINDFQDLGKKPMLGLAPNGELTVEWRIADDKHLGVWPLDSGHVYFAFIGPSEKPGERFRLSGKDTIAKVIDILREHGVDQWGDACPALLLSRATTPPASTAARWR